MFTAQQYRAKADGYGTLLETAHSPAEYSEYQIDAFAAPINRADRSLMLTDEVEV